MERLISNNTIDLNIRPTKGLGQRVVTNFLEFLLYARYQIPFYFELFERVVRQKNQELTEHTSRRPDWKTEKQVKLAYEACEKVCGMKKIIHAIYLHGVEIMFLLGSTIHTAKESYVIKFNHYRTDNHFMEDEEAAAKKILLKILEHEDMKMIQDNTINQTNMFLLFKRHCLTVDDSDFIELPDFELPNSCKKFFITFRYPNHQFEIFEEQFQDMNISKFEEKEPANWCQSKQFIKGFKDFQVNNKSIWFS